MELSFISADIDITYHIEPYENGATSAIDIDMLTSSGFASCGNSYLRLSVLNTKTILNYHNKDDQPQAGVYLSQV